ncbi:MAG: hypothetical protein JXA60_13135 [Candidatus Coatesbacteria bacterium]|nr:hypothetical protein [Candidatus Coatesbacteria bacterium]
MSPESVRICAICGKKENPQEDESFGRCVCQRIVCADCWDFDKNKCNICAEEEKNSAGKQDIDLGESTLILKRGSKKKSQTPEDLFGGKKKKKTPEEEEEEKAVIADQENIKTQFDQQVEEKPVEEEKEIIEVKKEEYKPVLAEFDEAALIDKILNEIKKQPTPLPDIEGMLASKTGTYEAKIKGLEGKAATLEVEIEAFKERISDSKDIEKELIPQINLLKTDIELIKTELKCLSDKAKELPAGNSEQAVIPSDLKEDVKKIVRINIEEKMSKEIPERLEAIVYKNQQEILEKVDGKISILNSTIGNVQQASKTEDDIKRILGESIAAFKNEIMSDIQNKFDDFRKEVTSSAPSIIEELVSLNESAEHIKKRKEEGWAIVNSTLVGDKLSITFKR